MNDASVPPPDGPQSDRKDIFEKCWKFNRARALQEAGLYIYFETFGGREGCGPSEMTLGDRKILMFGSNDYLDLTWDPRVKEAAAAAIHKYGTGCSGSRLLNGTLPIHVQLEEELAEFMGKEEAIVFGTGFQANYATIAALANEGELILCEHNLHASLVDGALRSSARTMRYRHNDMQHLEKRLQQANGEGEERKQCQDAPEDVLSAQRERDTVGLHGMHRQKTRQRVTERVGDAIAEIYAA